MNFRLFDGPGLHHLDPDLLPAEHIGRRAYEFLGRHTDLVYGALDEGPRVLGGCASLELGEFLDGWRRFHEGTEPRMALIVRLAIEMGRTVREIGERPRHVLRRRRSMERVSSVRQIDPAGVRWLVRQPGSNLAERAGPRQRVLAVIREETVDTLENRVMRDLFDRSKSECRRWLGENSDFEESKRYAEVARFSSVVRRLRRVGPLSAVKPVQGQVEPNYVLQHDDRYSQIWPWYLKLRRRQQEEDRMWRWGHRSFAEATRLSIAWALDELEHEAVLPSGVGYERRLLLRSEQRYGAFVDPRSELSGWLIRSPRGMRALSMSSGPQLKSLEHYLGFGSRLHQVIPDAVIASHSPFSSEATPTLVAVWARMRMTGDMPMDEICTGLARATATVRGAARVHVVLVEPALDEANNAKLVEERSYPVSKGPSVSVSVISTPLRLDRARDVLIDQMHRAFVDGGVT
ncbi:MAG: DUF2357 domain-containing protein [Planctomycetes bacterium]|nr:DUF2357 domain-containing protein [Planctomycetota bacterium]